MRQRPRRPASLLLVGVLVVRVLLVGSSGGFLLQVRRQVSGDSAEDVGTGAQDQTYQNLERSLDGTANSLVTKYKFTDVLG